MNMSPDDLPRVPGAPATRVNMPNYKQYGEAMYSQEDAPVQMRKPQQQMDTYQDLQPTDRNPLILLGLGLAGGALIGAAIFFVIMPNYAPSSDKKVVEPQVITQSLPAKSNEQVAMNMNAPTKVEVPIIVAPAPVVVAPPPPLPVIVAPVAVAPVVIAPPPPPVIVVAPVATLPRSEVLALLNRGKAAISEGDISLARTFFARAANANDGLGTMMLAETYDAEMLKTWGVRGIKADAARAKELYLKASLLGETQARLRIENLR